MKDMEKKTVGRRPEAEAEVTRQRIIEVARQLFAERGFEAVGLREIANRAGATHGLVRHHFGTKLSVWKTVVDCADRDFSAALGPLAALDVSGDIRAAAAQFVHRFVEIAAQHPDLIRLLMHEGTQQGPRLAYLLQFLSSAHKQLAPMVQRLHADGLLKQFSTKTLFHFLLFSSATPFAMSSLSAGLIGAESSVKAQAGRITRTLGLIYDKKESD
jgi:TetR/AcrR family transcriptional regulator